ncbi:fused MFS/spermidine synthase [Yaniella flava]|uniref:Fused MFS/spermidine synthase n=1 Tax=Yaniella flava TaxID=287930 RepID=A0ABP5G1T2_9MICC
MDNTSEHARIIPAEFDDGWVLEIDGEIQSHVDPNRPNVLRFEYLRRIGNLLDVSWPPTQPIRILHLGAGALTLVRYVQATRPGSNQTVIELESDLVDLVTEKLPLADGTKLNVITGDARAELQRSSEGDFDAIVVDIFTGHDTATHLTDRTFYADALHHLAEQGLLLVNIGDDEGLGFFVQQADVLQSVARDAGQAGVWALSDASTLNERRAGNIVVAASANFPTDHDDVTALRSRLSAAGPHPASVLVPSDTASLIHTLRG